ncbi:transposase [Streptomyces sp. NPDC047017]|uniref:IS701 family transposase n=1 Tax=Streptomyces sp. NPDC047017 TaxID=3155024 RepID=UPI0033F68328
MDDVFRSLRRAEQRRWAREYLWALIHVSGKKTPRRLGRAPALPSSAVHGLDQFINASPWDWRPVRRRLARRAAAAATPLAWTVAELIIPKTGEHSVGVHRRVDGTTGRTVNCQRALGLFLATDTHCLPLDWSLLLSGPWEHDAPRRRRARVPETETARPAGAHVVDHAAGALAHAPDVPWVLDLTRYEDATGVLAGLARLGREVVCEVGPGQAVLVGQHLPAVSTVGALMAARHARQAHLMAARNTEGRSRAVPVRTYQGTVRLPHPGPGPGAEGDARTYRVLEQPDPNGRGTRYWITTLVDRRVEEVLGLGRVRTAARTAVGTLRERYGVLDFEGRSFPGWHHHMTMASAAHVYEHLYGASRATPGAPAPPPAELTGVAG